MPSFNKAVALAAALVADGWAERKTSKNIFVTDGRRDQRTEGPKSGL